MAERTKIIRTRSGIVMNVNCVIGLGIFTAPGIVWNTLNSPLAIIILWIAGGIISIAAAFTYAKLGELIEQGGGEIKYFIYLNMFNEVNKKLADFVSYLFSFFIIIVFQPGKISTELQVAAQYFVHTVNNNPSELNSNVGWEDGWSTLRLKLIAIITLAIITGCHIPSSRVANFINFTFAGIKLVILAIIAIAGLVKLPSVLKEHSNIWSEPFDYTKRLDSYSSSFVLIMFCYDGWNNLNYSLDEFEDPKKNLTISNLSSAIIVTILYLLANVAFISVVPKELVFKNNKIIVSYFFKELLGEKAGKILSFIVPLSGIGTAAALVFNGSRVIACAADLDYIPYFSDKLKWGSKDNTPKNALVAQFMWCSLLIILIKDGISSDFYGSFSNFSWYGGLFMYGLTGIVLLYFRYKNKETGGKFYYFLNLLILIFIVGKFCGLIFPYFDTICPEIVSNCEEYLKIEKIRRKAPYFIGAGFIAIGAICYFMIYLRKGDDHVHDDDVNASGSTLFKYLRKSNII